MMMPMARCKPLPPLILRLETTTPIKVNNNTVNGVAVRRYNSTRKVFRPSEPRRSSIFIKFLSSGVVSLSFIYSSFCRSPGFIFKFMCISGFVCTVSCSPLIYRSVAFVSFQFFLAVSHFIVSARRLYTTLLSFTLSR